MAGRRTKRDSHQPGLDMNPAGKVPDWALDDLVACGRGPYEGHWYTQSQWAMRGVNQQRMRDLGSTRSWGALDYVLTREQVPHPGFPQVMGIRAVFQPDGHR